jgi:hypothetical protein
LKGELLLRRKAGTADGCNWERIESSASSLRLQKTYNANEEPMLQLGKN